MYESAYRGLIPPNLPAGYGSAGKFRYIPNPLEDYLANLPLNHQLLLVGLVTLAVVWGLNKLFNPQQGPEYTDPAQFHPLPV